MPNFINLPPFTEDGDVHVVVETPRGSRAKFAYDTQLETFILSKSLLTGLTYPYDWGFVPSTKAAVLRTDGRSAQPFLCSSARSEEPR
jgi:inorganic pyrophosphatase